MSEKEISCCEKPLEFIVQEGWAVWQSHRPEISNCSSCEAYFEKKPEKDLAYKRLEGEENYQCTNCESVIVQVTRSHPIWDGPGPCSGGGQCEYESVPYCPTCEEKPSITGWPIRIH